MSIAVDATGTEQWNIPTGVPVSSINFTGITVGNGSNTALLIVMELDTFSGPPDPAATAVWDNGGTNQSMTRTIVGTTGGCYVVIFTLLSPTPGNKTCALSWTGSFNVQVNAISFTGVDQTGGSTSFPNTYVNSVTALVVNTTTASGNYCVSMGSGTGTFTNNPTGTLLYLDNGHGANTNAASVYQVGVGGAQQIGMTTGGSFRCIVAVDVAALPPVAVPSAFSILSNVVAVTHAITY